MKLSFVFSICCAFLFLSACNKDAKPVSVDLNKPFELEFQESADFQEGGFELSFIEVNGDSRCPSDVDCIVAGEVIITLKVTKGDAVTEIKMIHSSALTIATYGDYKILLTDVSPYPKSTDSIKDKDYELTLEIREK